ncbi:uncharacterized protein LOC144067259 isoform X2 [Stigmatopora argus]
MCRERYLPKFKDILEYADYLNLDEPIIGFNFLVEVPGGQADHQITAHRYRCTLCNTYGNSPEMINHVIGRKHRQKYIEKERPDLVVWENDSVFPQTGTIIRTTAAIIARQDGSGRPKPMKKRKKGRKSPTKVPLWPKKNEEPPKPSSMGKRNQDFQGSQFHDSGLNLESKAPLPPTRASSLKMADSRKTTNLYDQQLGRHDNWERGLHQGKNMDPGPFPDNSFAPSICNPSKETQWKWERPAEGYGTEREPETNKKLFSEEVPLQFQPQRSDNHGNEQHWSSHKDPILRLGSSKAQSPTKNVHSPDCDFIDYHHGMRKAESLSLGSKKSHSPPEDSCSNFKIPESFRRFMNPSNETSFNRKRKSRFSDATPEEVEVAQRVFNTGLPGAKLRSALRSANEMVQQGSRGGMHYSDQFSQSKLTSKHGKILQEDSIFRSVDNFCGEEHNYREGNWTNIRDAQVYKQGHGEARDLIGNRYDKTGGQEEMYSPHRLDELVLQPNRFQRSEQEPERFLRASKETDRFQRGAHEPDRFQRGALEVDRFQRGALEVDRFQRGALEADRFQRGAQDGDRFQRGAPEADRFQRGAPEADRFQRGAPEPERFQRGAQEAERFQRGAQDGDRFQRGAQDGDRFQRGAQDGDRFQRGAPEPDRFQRGAPEADRFQRGAQDGDHFQRGAPEADRFQRGAPEADRFQRGAPEPDRFQRGAQEADRFQRGAQDGDRFQRGAPEADRFQRGAPEADRFQRGAQKPDRFQAGAEQPKRYEGRAQQRFQEGDLQTGSPGISNSHLAPLNVAVDPNDENPHVKKLEKLKSTILQFMARN